MYRRRYGITGVFIFLALAALLYGALTISGGLTPAEQASSVRAMSLDFVSVNSPFYLLQHISITLFGFSTFAIKLPSVVLAALLGICIFFLFRRWLAPSAAMFGSLLVFSGTTFLSIAGTGSPAILFILYPVILLFFGTRVAAHDKVSVVFALLLLIALAAALLTPTIVYLVLLAIVIGVFNPHVRYGFRSLRAGGIILLGLGFLLALAPLAYLFLKDPSTIETILSIPSDFSIGAIIGNIHELYGMFGRFLHPGISNGMIAPVVGLSAIGLMALGLYRLFRGIYSARSQFLLSWSLISLIIVILEPANAIVAYLPIILLAVFGLGQLIAIWYRTFPLNPYARFSAIIPIGILIAGIVIGSTLRYVNTVRYAPGSAELYSHDLQVLQTYLSSAKLSDATLAVLPGDVAFYTHASAAFTHVVSVDSLDTVNGTLVTVSQRADGTPSRILTDSRSTDAARFYVYR